MNTKIPTRRFDFVNEGVQSYKSASPTHTRRAMNAENILEREIMFC